jgi:DNA primase large subunit
LRRCLGLPSDHVKFYVEREEFLAKYPFHSKAKGYVAFIDLSVEELAAGGEELRVAEKRIMQALEQGEEVGAVMHSKKFEVEVFSFPLAVMLAAAVGDKWLQKRFALYESRRAEAFMSDLISGSLISPKAEETNSSTPEVPSS